MLAYGALQEGDLLRAGLLFEEAMALMRGAGEVWSLGILVSDLAALRVLEGRHEDAGALAREALGFCQSLGDRRGIGWCLQTIVADIKRVVSTAQDVDERHSTTMPSSSSTDQDGGRSFDAPTSNLRLAAGLLRTFDLSGGPP